MFGLWCWGLHVQEIMQNIYGARNKTYKRYNMLTWISNSDQFSSTNADKFPFGKQKPCPENPTRHKSVYSSSESQMASDISQSRRHWWFTLCPVTLWWNTFFFKVVATVWSQPCILLNLKMLFTTKWKKNISKRQIIWQHYLISCDYGWFWA